jgi:hypothetical protein
MRHLAVNKIAIFSRDSCSEMALAFGNRYNLCRGEIMSETLEAVLEAALRLPP